MIPRHLSAPKSAIRQQIYGERPLKPLTNAPVLYVSPRERRMRYARLLLRVAMLSFAVTFIGLWIASHF
jgi:hypothetical protein